MMLDALDRKIIASLQEGLPLVKTPYEKVAQELELSEEALISRLSSMKARGIIRRIGAATNHYKLGITANGMTVWDVDDAALTHLGRKIGTLDFVSHCYERPRHLPDWPYNLFAMVHGTSREEVETKRAEIAQLLGEKFRQSDILYSTRILKKTGLRLRQKGS